MITVKEERKDTYMTRYILISRPGQENVAVEPAVVTSMEHRQEPHVVLGPVTLKRIRDEGIPILSTEEYFDKVHAVDCKALVHGREFSAEVVAFDRVRGEGTIHIAALDLTLPIYCANITGADSMYDRSAFALYVPGEHVQVRLEAFPGRVFATGLTSARTRDHEMLG
jgi:hypothetical protein